MCVKWIQQRLLGQETRNKLTDFWADHDIKKGEEYAIGESNHRPTLHSPRLRASTESAFAKLA